MPARWESDEKLKPWEKDELASPRSGVSKAVGAFGGGVNEGLAGLLGAPVDLANWALGAVDLGSERPFGGSAMLKDLARKGGLIASEDYERPPGLKPFHRAGQTFGEAVGIGAAPLTIARTGAKVHRLAEPLIQAARTSPGRTAAIELMGAEGAAIGRGVSEALAPGNELAGMGAEIVGGVANPGAIVARGIKSGSQAISSYLPGGTRRRAGRTAAKVVRGVGESPGAVVEALRAPRSFAGPRLTAAEQSGSLAMVALQKRLARDVPELDNQLRKQAEQMSKDFNSAYDDALRRGDTGALTEIANARVGWLREILNARIASAEKAGTQITQALGPRQKPSSLGKSAKETLLRSLAEAEKQESRLWSRVVKERIVPQGDLAPLSEAMAGARGRLLPDERFPGIIEAQLGRMFKEGAEPVPAKDLVRLRGVMLGEMRRMMTDPAKDQTMRGALGLMEDSIIRVLNDPEYDEARQFTATLSELFKTGAPGKILGVDLAGGARIPDEAALSATVGRGGEAGAAASRQIEEAAGLSGLPDVPRETTRPLQLDFLRNAVTDLVDPKTGRISANALERWRRDNVDLLERLPGLNTSFDSVTNAQRTMETFATQSKKVEKLISGQQALSRLIKNEDPTRVVGQILSGPSPASGYREIAKLAGRGGADARAGLRRATFDYLLGKGSTAFPGSDLRAALTDKPNRLQRSLMETMIDQKVMDRGQAGRLLKIADEAKRLEEIAGMGGRVDEVIDDATALTELLQRVSGARLASHVGGGGYGGSSLIVASAGSKFVRRILNKIPAGNEMKLLAEAVNNPKLMADLIEAGDSPRLQRSLERQINAFLLQTAIMDDEQRENLDTEVRGLLVPITEGTLTGPRRGVQ